MTFDPDIVVVDQVTVQFSQRAFGHPAEKHCKPALFYHMDTLGLGSVGRCGRYHFISPSACGQLHYCFSVLQLQRVPTLEYQPNYSLF